jgi:hypothetical protein
MSAPEPITTRREGWQLLAWALALFAACLALHTRNNDFPYFYHPDEPGKVEQVLTAHWNFHHPMLLLATTRLAVKAGAVPANEQAVVEAGRWISACFTALAVVALSLLAYAWRGWAAAFAAGAALVTHHQLFELAHYLKEDTALLAGFALTFLMLLACWWRPSNLRVTLLGAACGLAVSGKYLGVLSLALAVPIVWRNPERRGARLGIFTAALALTFFVVNLPLFLHLATFRESFGREVEFVVKGQRGLTRSVPHTQYWNVFIDNTTPAIWILLLCFLRARWHERRRLSLPEWIIIVFPFAYALALSFSPKTNDRYFLPATALFTLQAALGTVDLVHAFAFRHTRRRWLIVAIGVLLLFQIVSPPRPAHWNALAEYWRAFRVDDNADLLEWMRTNLPPDAVIARDNRIQIPDPERKKHAARGIVVPQRVIFRDASGKAVRFAADVGTVDSLGEQGITHVIVSESDYGRFFLEGLRPQAGERADFDRRKAFYEQLLREGELIFERERSPVIYLHPGIRVYRLRPPPPF